MGSYFGSSLCAVDLNADGLSDLLVGAPMFSEIRDEGQVTVYINRGNVSTVLGYLWTGCGRGTFAQWALFEHPSGPCTEPHCPGRSFLPAERSMFRQWNVTYSVTTANIQGSRKILMAAVWMLTMYRELFLSLSVNYFNVVCTWYQGSPFFR